MFRETNSRTENGPQIVCKPKRNTYVEDLELVMTGSIQVSQLVDKVSTTKYLWKYETQPRNHRRDYRMEGNCYANDSQIPVGSMLPCHIDMMVF